MSDKQRGSVEIDEKNRTICKGEKTFLFPDCPTLTDYVATTIEESIGSFHAELVLHDGSQTLIFDLNTSKDWKEYQVVTRQQMLAFITLRDAADSIVNNLMSWLAKEEPVIEPIRKFKKSRKVKSEQIELPLDEEEIEETDLEE